MPTSSKITTARSGVFISYARDDGEKFAKLLLQKLKAEHISAWMDRTGMEGGDDWWRQLTEALDKVEFMALVMTPEALTSDIVRREWRYARREGVCVYPIKGVPNLDFNSLPRWMRSVHFYDVGTVEKGLDGPEWQKFVNDLKTRCQPKRVPFMFGDLPKDLVSRPREFDQLLKLLCDERREEPVAITAALKGAGGYGKTTLAKALCHDKRIQDAFDDGILWVTLGENPSDLTGKVEDLIVTLGDERPGFATLDAAVNSLKELLAERDILIVIDDVWDRAHLNPFIQGGPYCARLITTRNFDTLPAGTAKVHVDAMQQDEATALLAPLDETSPEDERLRVELNKLASRLGEWPLLLRLVNSALRIRIENDKQSLWDALEWVNKALEKRGLTYFDAKNSAARDRAVARTIGVSLDLLSSRDRERYSELAIFPEDVEIPLSTLEKLWARTGALDEFDTEELCSRLNSFSLLWSYDANQQRIRLHDVVRKFLIDQQGNKLPSIHAQLLEAHRPSGSSGWAEMPEDEPYLWDHLAHHLVEAGCGDELVATVKDWRYLVSKTFIRKSLAVEADLLTAEKTAAHDDILQLLRRNFVNSGHLLNRSERRDDVELTLFTRLQHLDSLKPITRDLEQHLKRPCILPAQRLPDLPHPALVRTLSGHVGWVNSCAVSTDGATIVSASSDQTLKVWDGRTGVERFTLSGHAGGVNCCAITRAGETIVSASDDGTLKVWDGHNGAQRFTLKGHAGGVKGCAISVDGATIVSASDDGTLKVWDGTNGTERFTLNGHLRGVNGCAISFDGATITSVSDDGALKVWNGITGAERFTLKSHTGCAVSADGAIILSALDDGTLSVWDGRSGEQRLKLTGHVGRVWSCAMSADGLTIVSTSHDGTLKVWDGRSGVERFTLSGHAGLVNGCALSADGATLVSASSDQTLRMWDVQSGGERFTPTGYAAGVNGCAVSADGAMIVSAWNDVRPKVWDRASRAERFMLNAHADSVNCCAVSADGTMIVSSSFDGTLKVWDARSGAELFTFCGRPADVNSCTVSADGATIVAAFREKVKVWDGFSGTERFTLSGHTNEVMGCAVSADGAMIVSASIDQTLKVWDGRIGAERFTLRGHEGWVPACAMSADGVTIVSASHDGTLKVWDGRSGTERFTLKGHASRVLSCAMSRDGVTIVSASVDGTLKVWDGRTRECLSTLQVDGLLSRCACSADGEIIAAVGARGVYVLLLVR